MNFQTRITWTCGERTGGGPLGCPFFRRVQLLGRIGPVESRSEGPGPGPGAQVAEGQQRVLSAQLIIGHALEATRSDADHFLCVQLRRNVNLHGPIATSQLVTKLFKWANYSA